MKAKQLAGILLRFPEESVAFDFISTNMSYVYTSSEVWDAIIKEQEEQENT